MYFNTYLDDHFLSPCAMTVQSFSDQTRHLELTVYPISHTGSEIIQLTVRFSAKWHYDAESYVISSGSAPGTPRALFRVAEFGHPIEDQIPS